ncbi:H(+)-transporting V1 sector ATPase subunit A [Linnemannia exigua]|uniref:H(+)-transporting V1 sector ATPase subunit A n=1 Tax=Linnemannia exigua TaxID=604196 RepID=A0AAD4DCJ5_9FUNG|nr:H(+)-transporting V1 sector ATPase subunit A [Linnemannia exigua]
MSDPDDDDYSTADPSGSESDDAPNIDMGFGVNTRVFMADGTTKRIKNIQPGDYDLGPDRMPRLVIGTSIGSSPMIQVQELMQNAAHVSDSTLGLVMFACTPKQSLHLTTAQVQSVHLQTYHLTAAIDFETGRLRYHALKSGFTDASGMQEKLAYIWGTWTGDGNSIHTSIAVNLKDREQIARIEDVCYDLGLAASLYKQSESQMERGCMGGEVSITSRVHKRRNYLMTFLRRLGLGNSGSKYVPRWLRKESISAWEHFLAGLIDSDGCCTKQWYSFVSDSDGATPHDRDKYRYGAFHQDVVNAIHFLPDLPTVPPQNPDEETRALIHQLNYSTLTLLAKRYHNFGYNREIELPSPPTLPTKDQVFEKLPIEVIRPLVLLARNPSSHHAVALTLNPVTDGLLDIPDYTPLIRTE